MTALLVILILLGLLLLAMEFFVIPGFGISGIAGLAALVGAAILSYNLYGSGICILVSCSIVVLLVLMLLLLMRSKTWKRLSLETKISSKVDAPPAEKGLARGTEGVAVTRLAPGGMVRFGEVNVEVATRGSLVEPGAAVIITEMDGNRIFVEEKKG